MYNYRISKYNPRYRDYNGAYLKDEWSAIDDIGKSFEGKILTCKEYINTENNYIKAIFAILELHKISFLYIKDTEFCHGNYDEFINFINVKNELYNNDYIDMYKNIDFLKILNLKSIEIFSRLALRENIWGRLYFPRKIKIHFGYDYLIGISCSRSLKNVIYDIEKLDLYVEEIKKPYF